MKCGSWINLFATLVPALLLALACQRDDPSTSTRLRL